MLIVTACIMFTDKLKLSFKKIDWLNILIDTCTCIHSCCELLLSV